MSDLPVKKMDKDAVKLVWMVTLLGFWAGVILLG